VGEFVAETAFGLPALWGVAECAGNGGGKVNKINATIKRVTFDRQMRSIRLAAAVIIASSA
jgi:hypothetical protein